MQRILVAVFFCAYFYGHCEAAAMPSVATPGPVVSEAQDPSTLPPKKKIPRHPLPGEVDPSNPDWVPEPYCDDPDQPNVCTNITKAYCEAYKLKFPDRNCYFLKFGCNWLDRILYGCPPGHAIAIIEIIINGQVWYCLMEPQNKNGKQGGGQCWPAPSGTPGMPSDIPSYILDVLCMVWPGYCPNGGQQPSHWKVYPGNVPLDPDQQPVMSIDLSGFL